MPFGHGAYLPRMLRDAGQSYYVMMRPGVGEKELPSPLFRWQSPDGAEVLTFRITNGYIACGEGLKYQVDAAIAQAPEGIGHVMCFYGVGDHGGGPTRESVEWILAHREYASGVRLEFSSPTRFFREVEAPGESCPVVVGELQMHAIGCYSVCGDLKRAVRREELAAIDLQRALASLPAGEQSSMREKLDETWRLICFNQFHDILPGSSIRSAVQVALGEMGAAGTQTSRAVHAITRREKSELEGHRIRVANVGQHAHNGLAECEVWLDHQQWEHHLEDSTGEVVPHQTTSTECLNLDSGPNTNPRVLFPIDLPAGGGGALRVAKGKASAEVDAQDAASFEAGILRNAHLDVTFGETGIAEVRERVSGEAVFDAPVELLCLNDFSDTWSHGIDRYAIDVRAKASFGPPTLIEEGPLRATVRLDGRIGDTDAMLYVSLHGGESLVRCRLEANYRERHSVLKARMSVWGGAAKRVDRVAGGWIERESDGREYPLHHAIAVQGRSPVGLILPDSFAVHCDEKAMYPTLIRNSLHALHNGAGKDVKQMARLNEYFGTDEGVQSIRFCIALGADAVPVRLEQHLQPLQRPLQVWDDYLGGGRLSRFR